MDWILSSLVHTGPGIQKKTEPASQIFFDGIISMQRKVSVVL